jgi:hypothetical protein
VMGSEPAQVCGPARFASGVRPAGLPAAAVPVGGSAVKEPSQSP